MDRCAWHAMRDWNGYGASDIRWMKLNENFIVKMLAIRGDAMRFIHSTRNAD